MPAKSRTRSKRWWEKLDEQAVRDALEDATVDAHDEDEQHSGLLTLIQEELQFPFCAKVLGDDVEIVDMEWPEDDEYGLDLVCDRNGQRHRVEARSVDLPKTPPEGHLYLAAYLMWKRMR